jgi:mortality factor 4-like protein 1
MTAQMWSKNNLASKTGKKRGGSDSGRGSEERQSSVPAKGTKRGRDNEIEKVCVQNFADTLNLCTN